MATNVWNDAEVSDQPQPGEHAISERKSKMIHSVKAKISSEFYKDVEEHFHSSSEKVHEFFGTLHNEVKYNAKEKTLKGPYEAMREAYDRLYCDIGNRLWIEKTDSAEDLRKKGNPKDKDGSIISDISTPEDTYSNGEEWKTKEKRKKKKNKKENGEDRSIDAQKIGDELVQIRGDVKDGNMSQEVTKRGEAKNDVASAPRVGRVRSSSFCDWKNWKEDECNKPPVKEEEVSGIDLLTASSRKQRIAANLGINSDLKVKSNKGSKRNEPLKARMPLPSYEATGQKSIELNGCIPGVHRRRSFSGKESRTSSNLTNCIADIKKYLSKNENGKERLSSQEGSEHRKAITVDIPKTVDVDVLRSYVESQNKYPEVQLKFRDGACVISGCRSDSSKVETTKAWIEGFMDSQSPVCLVEHGSRLDSEQATSFIVVGKVYFAFLRKFFSVIGRPQRVNFDHEMKRLHVFFDGEKKKMEAIKNMIKLQENQLVFYDMPRDLSRNNLAQISKAEKGFLEFISNGDCEKYIFLGKHEQFKKAYEKKVRDKKCNTSHFQRNQNTTKGCSLEVSFHVGSINSASSSGNIVMFINNLEKCSDTLKIMGIDVSSKAPPLNISENVAMVSTKKGRKFYFVSRLKIGNLHDLYRTALYHASDGADKLVITLAMTDTVKATLSAHALCEVILEYDLGKRVHDFLSRITIAMENGTDVLNIRNYLRDLIVEPM